MKRSLLLLALTSLLSAAEMPRIEKSPQGSYRLMVDGRPFLILSGQVSNSSGWKDQLDRAWPIFNKLNANTAEIPVYWEVIEPRQGEFDFTSVDMTIEGARKSNLRLVLLWFATWKNGVMDYVPQRVKQDTARYPRRRNRAGEQIRVLSPISA